MRALRYSTVSSYRDGVAAGWFDRDLDTDDRAAVVRLLDMALYHLQWAADVPTDDIIRAVHDPIQSSDAVNRRVRDILTGCAS